MKKPDFLQNFWPHLAAHIPTPSFAEMKSHLVSGVRPRNMAHILTHISGSGFGTLSWTAGSKFRHNFRAKVWSRLPTLMITHCFYCLHHSDDMCLNFLVAFRLPIGGPNVAVDIFCEKIIPTTNNKPKVAVSAL